MTFVDAEHRHLIETNVGRPFFVEAGAGTGKTTEMVARIAGLIARRGVPISSIVAITFTEAAAGELRERLRSALERLRAGGDPTEAQRAQEALLTIEDAAIQTIHGFAHRIVARFAVRVGVPPVFEVQDRIAGKLHSDQRWGLFMRETFGGINSLPAGDQQLIRTATALGLNQNHLRLLARALSQQWQRAVPLARVAAQTWPALEVDDIVQELRQAFELQSGCGDPNDSLIKWMNETLQPWAARLERAREAGDPLGTIEALAAAPSINVGRKGAKTRWDAAALEQVRELLTNIGGTIGSRLNQPRQWAIGELVRLLSVYVVSEARNRRTQGTLEFHDLLVYALDLARMPTVVRELRETYRYLFVDEFQDTDAIQVELIDRLTEVDQESAPSELFTVGDSKQSIYRFRGADLEQFHAVRSRGDSEILQLSTNFRTVPLVLAWINEAFAPLLAHDDPDWLPLAAARPADPSIGSVEVLGHIVDNAKARDVREIEANEVVARIVQAKQDRWLVADNDGNARAIRYGDMATLMPTRRSLPALERELRRAGVPYRVESRSLIWVTQEIRDVTSILRAVANPRDEVALIAALRTPALACGDDDLLSWRRSGGQWRYEPMPETDVPDHPVAQALARLAELHEQQRWVPVSQFVTDVISHMRFYELAFARPRQREAWHRLRFLVDRARAWTEQGGFGLHAFVQWIETQENESADALESVVPEADDDAVRIMTVHASKGLEFPMVILTGLGSSDTLTDSARVLWSATDRIQVRIGNKARGWQTPEFANCEQLDSERDSREQARVLYVAATRARDHLIVSTFRPAGSRFDKSLAARLDSVLTKDRVTGHPLRASTPSSVSPLPTVSTQLAALVGERSAIISKAGRPLSLSATAIATQMCGAETVLPSVAAASKDSGAAELAERLAFGSAVHSGLETIDLEANPAVVSETAAAVAAEHGISHRTADIARSTQLALTSSAVAAALDGGRCWREVPVFTTVADRVVGGSIDLLYEIHGQLVVVDYKTEDVSAPGAVESALLRYRWQLVTYALACQRSTGLRVSKAVLLFIAPSADHATAVDIVGLDDLTVELTDSVLPALF